MDPTRRVFVRSGAASLDGDVADPAMENPGHLAFIVQYGPGP